MAYIITQKGYEQILASDGIILADGTKPLSADWDIGDGRMIKADKIQARDGDGLSLFEDSGKGIFVKDGGNTGFETATPRTVVEIYNDRTGTSDLPGGANSLHTALLLVSDATQTGSRPGVVQIGLRTPGGIAYDVNTCFIGSSEANAQRVATMGVWGTVGVSSHTNRYVYFDGREDGTWDKATLKLDGDNPRVGIALPTNQRPLSTLDIDGSVAIGTYAGSAGGTAAPANGMIVSGIAGFGTPSPDRQTHSEVSDAVTDDITYAQRLSHISSGTVVAGFGTGIEFELEENDGTNRVAGALEFLWTDAGEGANADADMIGKLMLNDGAMAEVWRAKSNGDFIIQGSIGIIGGFKANLVTKTEAYTTTADDYTILCDASGGSFTITLIALASHLGGVYHIKKIDSSGNTVTIYSAETIDGAATAVLTTQYESITIQAGSEWEIL